MQNLQARETPDKIQTEPEIVSLEPTEAALLEPWARRLQPEISSWTPHGQPATDSAIKLTERSDVPLQIEPYEFLKVHLHRFYPELTPNIDLASGSGHLAQNFILSNFDLI